MAYFDNIRLYLEDNETGKIKVKFVCSDCGKEMEEAEQYRIPVRLNVPDYHLAEYWCKECYLKRYGKK